MKLNKILLLWIVNLLFLSQFLFSNSKYYTTIFDSNIKTLQVANNGNPLALPIIYLDKSSDVLTISFDEMSHNILTYNYVIKHCNANWSESSLSSSEFIRGFANGTIEEAKLSVNTTFLYTNYQFQLPNDDTKFTVSGNYIVQIYEDNFKEKPVAQMRFYVLDSKVEVQGSVRGNTDKEINNSLQQIDFDILTRGLNIQDPNSEIKLTVRQNNRLDNAVTDLKPTYISNDKFSYKNNSKLIFEGGNEYLRFDFSSIYNYDERINTIKFIRPHYEVFLAETHPRSNSVYESDSDVNGRFIVNYQNGYDSSVEADYMFVHLNLAVKKALFDGAIYIGGEWNYNQLNETNLMNYDSYNLNYSKTLLLKQGGYNYQFWCVPNRSNQVTLRPIDGSYWQTQNEYAIYVYYRPWGGRYDQLVGVKIL